MIEEVLLNYGVLGLWTIFNLSTILYYRKNEQKREEKLTRIVENNTIALTKVYEVTSLCKNRH